MVVARCMVCDNNLSQCTCPNKNESTLTITQGFTPPQAPAKPQPLVYGLKDGGTRKTYATGAQKEDDSKTEGKGAYHLLPPGPIRKVAEIYRKGALKYSARNWELGIPLSRYLDSAKRHLDQFHEGRIDEDHLHQALWNLFGLSHTLDMIEKGLLPEELNDLPSYGIGPCYRKPGPGLRKNNG